MDDYIQILKGSRRDLFCKKDVPENLSKLTRKHLCWSLFLIKRSLFIKKEAPTQVFSYEFCEIFKNTFLPTLPVAASKFSVLRIRRI